MYYYSNIIETQEEINVDKRLAKKRDESGSYGNIFQELSKEDELFSKYMRLSLPMFNNILDKISEHIKKTIQFDASSLFTLFLNSADFAFHKHGHSFNESIKTRISSLLQLACDILPLLTLTY